ncbi:ribonuclease H-like protein [Ceratobasidium sp. AG-Ba]|nr:ribonuclease H-like protein [Ceratobasidium sp. AG-Ba]
MSPKPTPSESDYPGTVFFGVHRGHKTGVRATFAQLMKEIDGYKSPVWEAFNNKAHAEQFAKTGVVPSGATPVQPGAHNASGGKRTAGRSGSSGGGRFAAPLGRVGSTVSGSSSSLGTTKSMSALESTTVPGMKLGPTNSVPAFNRSPAPVGRPGATPLIASARSASTLSGSSRGHPASATTSLSSTSSRAMSGTASASTADTDFVNQRDQETIEVWTDGSCLGNGKAGSRAAYAVYFGEGDPRNEAKRVPGAQTNNRGELLGIIRALEIVDENVPNLIIYSDSQYSLNCLNWLPNWKKSGGLNSLKKPVVNYSMIRYMCALMDRRGDRLQLRHVRGHSDNIGNNAVDALANRAAREIHHVPDEVDWDVKRLALEHEPAVPRSGEPVSKMPSLVDITPGRPRSQIAKGSIARALESSQVSFAASDPEDEYNEFDDDDFLGIDESSLPQPIVPPPTAAAQPDANSGKRAREPAGDDEEIEDSETERKAVKKAGKKRRVKCPNCKSEFPI